MGSGLRRNGREHKGLNSAPYSHGTGYTTFLTRPHKDAHSSPFAFVQLYKLAVHSQFWSRLVGLPTCRKYLKQTCFAFSQ